MTSSPTNETEGRRRHRAPLTVPVILIAVFVMPISISGAALALPDISRDLGDAPTALQWVVNGFNVAFAGSILMWGAIADRLGYKRTFKLGAVVTLVGAVVSVVAPSLLILDLGRVVAGVGGAAIVTGGSALLSTTLSGRQRAKAFALLGTVVGLGLAVGPTISGLLVSVTGWKGVFAFAGFIAVVALLASPAVAADAPRAEAAKAKMLDLSALSSRRFLAYLLVPVAASLAFVPILTYLPVALSAIAGMDAAEAGLFMLPLTAPVLIAPALASMAVARIKWVSAMVVVNISIGALVLGDLGLLFFGADTSLALLIAPMILLGFGFGLPVGLVDAEALSAVPAHKSGAAAGLLNFVRLGSEAVVVAAYGAIVTALLVSKIDDTAFAHEVAAGGAGGATQYADSLHTIAIGMVVLTLVVAIAVNLLHLASRNEASPATHVPTLDEEKDAAVGH